MNAGPPLARIAALIGDPARALMLSTLVDGRSRTAGELARAAGITPQTASAHLGKLSEAGLLAVEKQGRHRYHRLGSADVAHVLEALMVVSAPSPQSMAYGPRERGLRRARTCYDHLAGEIAVQLADRWLTDGWIQQQAAGWRLTPSGHSGFAMLGIPAPDTSLRRPTLRPCLDWSERRPHLAGQLGASLLRILLAHDWLRRRRDSRGLLVTDAGERALVRWLQPASAPSGAP